jgi:hypothetical protein
VNNAVTQMDSTTQQNAALVEEASAASKSLEQRAQSLVELMAQFKTGADNQPRVVAQQRRPTATATVTALPKRRPPAARAESMPVRAKVSGGDASWQEF